MFLPECEVSRRLRPELLTGKQAEQDAKAFARDERGKLAFSA